MAALIASRTQEVSLSSEPYWPVIAAIDFGTSNSGYAFAFKDAGQINVSKIQLNKWQIGSASSSTEKAPTSVLLSPDKKFDSFGYKAETTFARLCDQKKEKGWWFFQQFKMMLFDSKLTREKSLYDTEGKDMPAIQVFSTVIAHLKECILNDIRKQNISIKDDDVLYVLTVPAIWSDAAKQFMREAATATQVGIKDGHLKLVLEPEAASLFCRQMKCRIARQAKGGMNLESLAVGQRYIILDLGGGTADIATHEVLNGGKLCELNNVRGNGVAGQRFNSNFFKILHDLFGEDIVNEWQTCKHSDFLKLLRAIEGCKWQVTDSEDGIFFDLPYSLVMHYEKKTGFSHAEVIQNSKHKENVEFSDALQLHIKSKLMQSLFDDILKEIRQHVNTILEESSGIDILFLAGGLSKSEYICHCIQRSFPLLKMVVPEDPGVAVLKGAVMLGERPEIIDSRLAQYSYGLGITEDFSVGIHKEEYKFTRDGKELCDYIFSKMIEKNAVLKYGDTFSNTASFFATMADTKKMTLTFNLFQSKTPCPQYYREEGCKRIGGIVINPPEGDWPDISRFRIIIIVGEAEFRFSVTDDLGREFITKVDFLGVNSE